METSQLETEKYMGLALSLASGILIGISFIITKKGLLDANKKSGTFIN
jgi:magnesium transporter